MSDEPTQDGRSLLQLAISLRLAAQRLAQSANRMQQAAQHQREQLDRLTLLRDRIVELLALCRRLSDKPRPASPSEPARPAAPAAPPPGRTQVPRPRLPASAFVEFSNWQEFEKFRRMPPIAEGEVASCDIDELIRRLNDEPGPAGHKR